MDPLPALITPAPEPPHAILRERNISGSLIPGLNYVEGWSSIGKTQDPVNPWCLGPNTASFFTKGKDLIQTCVLPGVESDSLDFSTACLDYQTQGYAQMQSGTRYWCVNSTQTAPYCGKWLFNAGPSTYSALGCLGKPSITYSYTKTGDGPPYLTSPSTTISGSGAVSSTGATVVTSAPSSINKTPAPSGSLTGSSLATNMNSSPSTTKTPAQSSLPTGINLAAIFGTLGGAGIIVVGALTIYIYLARKRRKMAAVHVGDSQKGIDDDFEAEKSLESISLASKTESNHQSWTAGAPSNLRATSGGESQTSLTENGEVDTFFEVEGSIQNEHGVLEECGESRDTGEEETFKWDIKIIDAQGTFRNATALLDTQCQIGNWISLRLVQRLDKLVSISKNFTPPNISEASGNSVAALGIIELEWKRVPRGNRIHQTKFYVYSTSGEIDVIFGVEYIVREKLLGVHQDALIPLLEHRKAKKGSKAAIALAEERHRQEMADLEARRAAASQDAQSQAQGQQQQYQDHQQGQR